MAGLLEGLTKEALAAQSFLYYIRYVGGLKAYPHVQRIVEEVERPVRNSLIIIPPGHGKSTIISQLYPSWYLGCQPNHSCLLISNTDKQAKLFLNANRHTFEHDVRWRTVFPYVQPDEDRGWSSDGLFLKWYLPEEGRWQSKPATEKDPALAAFGVGGPVIGRRADRIIVDDPYSEEMARSALQRQTFLDWFRRTLLSRLRPDEHCKIIIAMTRWHIDDVYAWAQELNRLEGTTGTILPPEVDATLPASAP